MTQGNLAVVLSDQGLSSEGAERARLLGEAVVAYRSALDVFTRAALPQDWATTQNNLALTLKDQASTSSGVTQIGLFQEAVAAMTDVLQVQTADIAPNFHAYRVVWIAEIEAEIARLKGE